MLFFFVPSGHFPQFLWILQHFCRSLIMDVKGEACVWAACSGGRLNYLEGVVLFGGGGLPSKITPVLNFLSNDLPSFSAHHSIHCDHPSPTPRRTGATSSDRLITGRRDKQRNGPPKMENGILKWRQNSTKMIEHVAFLSLAKKWPAIDKVEYSDQTSV